MCIHWRCISRLQSNEENNITFILRETKEAIDLFKDFNGYRIDDMTQLHETLKKFKKIVVKY